MVQSVLKIGLKVGGERTRVEIDEAKAIKKRFEKTIALATKRSEDTVIVVVDKLDVSNRAWPLASLQVLGPFLQQHVTTITIVNIEDIIASLLTEEGLQCLEYISTIFAASTVLVDLNVSHNALGTRGIAALTKLLSIPSLKRIYLNNCGLSAEVGETLYTLLLPVASQLQLLNLSRNQMGVGGCMAIQKLLEHCTSLQYLSYAGCRPLKEGTIALCKGLHSMVENSIQTHGISPFSYLNLDDCQINPGDDDDDDGDDDNEKDAIYTLCKAIAKSPLLTTLIVRDCNLQVTGIQRLCNAVRMSYAKLQYFDIGCNEIGMEGGTIVSNFIIDTQITSLETFISDTNEFDNDSLVVLVPSFQACYKLQTVILQTNEISSVQPFVYAELPTTFTKLDLTENVDLTNTVINQLKTKLGTKVEILYDDDLEDGDDDDDEADNGDDDDDDDKKKEAYDDADINDLVTSMSQSQI